MIASISNTTFQSIADTTKPIINIIQEPSFDTDSIVIIATSASLIISLFVNWYLHNKGYKDEYFKKIIEKRLKAYSSVENLLYKMRIFYFLNDDRNKPYLECFEDWETFDKYFQYFHEIGANSFIWLTLDMQDKINALQIFLNNEIHDLKDKTDCQQLGVLHFAEIGKRRREILSQLYGDLDNLYKIKFPTAKK